MWWGFKDGAKDGNSSEGRAGAPPPHPHPQQAPSPRGSLPGFSSATPAATTAAAPPPPPGTAATAATEPTTAAPALPAAAPATTTSSPPAQAAAAALTSSAAAASAAAAAAATAPQTPTTASQQAAAFAAASAAVAAAAASSFSPAVQLTPVAGLSPVAPAPSAKPVPSAAVLQAAAAQAAAAALAASGGAHHPRYSRSGMPAMKPSGIDIHRAADRGTFRDVAKYVELGGDVNARDKSQARMDGSKRFFFNAHEAVWITAVHSRLARGDTAVVTVLLASSWVDVHQNALFPEAFSQAFCVANAVASPFSYRSISVQRRREHFKCGPVADRVSDDHV